MPKLKPDTIIPTEAEDSAINRGIAADPDTYELDVAKMKHLQRVGRPKTASPKIQLTVRYDAEIVNAFKAGLHSLNSMRGSVSVVTGAVDWISSDEVCVAAASSMM